MKMTFRWYGDKDPVSLDKIREIPGMSGIVSALYTIPVGEAWDLDSVMALKRKANEKGLAFEVVESVPVHENIKLGAPERDRLIENYKTTVRNLAAAGVKVICYNFMPVFDWVRSELNFEMKDGSHALAYKQATVDALDPRKSSLSLPGWDESYTKEELAGLLEKYESVDAEKLFSNLVYFLSEICPVCEEVGIQMAIHPDDPPKPLFGLPRVITDEGALDRLFAAVPSPANGITFCTGSLGAGRANDLVKMAEKYAKAGRIPFAHLRNIGYDGDGEDFHETAHPTDCGSLDLYGIVAALVKGGFDGYVRPDHGRFIWGESGKPGYGLFDRALGAVYLEGLFEGIEKERKR